MVMGMYDKAPNFEETFNVGDRFVMLGAEYVGSIPTRYGAAEKSVLTIVSREHPDRKIRYSALGQGFARQAQNAERSDFPHVAEYVVVATGTSNNKVKLLARVDVDPREFIDGNDGPPLLDEGESLFTGEAPTVDKGAAIPF
jgi:hypothetical protein